MALTPGTTGRSRRPAAACATCGPRTGVVCISEGPIRSTSACGRSAAWYSRRLFLGRVRARTSAAGPLVVRGFIRGSVRQPAWRDGRLVAWHPSDGPVSHRPIEESSTSLSGWPPGPPASGRHPIGVRHGRSAEQEVAVKARYAPLAQCAGHPGHCDRADHGRGASSSPHQPQWFLPRAQGSEEQDRGLILVLCWPGGSAGPPATPR